jgi:ribosomal protein S18 acetylase RimI-like enzyme
VFGLPCYEIGEYSEAALAAACATPGHHSIKVDPLADKSPLQHYGFYYTDTLLVPVCTAAQLIEHANPQVGIDPDVTLQGVLPMCRKSFLHGRFHRDFNLSSEAADKRYMKWLEQLHAQGKVIGLLFENELAGFIAHQDGALVLHALGEGFRGRGLAKFLWSATCRHLFAAGETELSSSVSAANLAVVNLYASLGFRFRYAVDTYHRLTT